MSLRALASKPFGMADVEQRSLLVAVDEDHAAGREPDQFLHLVVAETAVQPALLIEAV
jgi:hypothetical protein